MQDNINELSLRIKVETKDKTSSCESCHSNKSLDQIEEVSQADNETESEKSYVQTHPSNVTNDNSDRIKP